MIPTLIYTCQRVVDSLRNERGATAVEYGIMVALIAAVIVTAVGLIGIGLNTTFGIVTTNLP